MIYRNEIEPYHVPAHINGVAYAVPMELCEDEASPEIRAKLTPLPPEVKKERLKPFAEQIALKTGDKYRVAE